LKTDQILEFGSQDYIRIEKKINFEKKINPEIDSNVSKNLISALKEYKEELLFILSDPIFFNFFAHNNFSKSYFLNYNLTVSDERMRDFIVLFLADDLISFFSLKLSKSTCENFKELDSLLDLKRYFPEGIIYKMTLLVYSKLDFAVSQLSVLNTNNYSSIQYIEYKAFYDLLSHFATIELDQKMDNLLSLVVRSYKKNTSSNFFSSVIKSMVFYNAFNENMSKTLVKNRDLLLVSIEDEDYEKMHRVIKIIIAVVFLLIAFNKTRCS
jgi:hypothetical protein